MVVTRDRGPMALIWRSFVIVVFGLSLCLAKLSLIMTDAIERPC